MVGHNAARIDVDSVWYTIGRRQHEVEGVAAVMSRTAAVSNDANTVSRRHASTSLGSCERTLKSPPTTTGHEQETSVSRTEASSSKNSADGFSEPGR